jgi:hypothetical protein
MANMAISNRICLQLKALPLYDGSIVVLYTLNHRNHDKVKEISTPCSSLMKLGSFGENLDPTDVQICRANSLYIRWPRMASAHQLWEFLLTLSCRDTVLRQAFILAMEVSLQVSIWCFARGTDHNV